jgi:hypothetical protein
LDKWINQFTQSRNLNWNSSKLLDEDRITSNLVSELFNKPFELFENNRELLDNLAYYYVKKLFMILRLKILFKSFLNMREKYQSINYEFVYIFISLLFYNLKNDLAWNYISLFLLTRKTFFKSS